MRQDEESEKIPNERESLQRDANPAQHKTKRPQN